jgi:hypothetical protein
MELQFREDCLRIDPGEKTGAKLMATLSTNIQKRLLLVLFTAL